LEGEAERSEPGGVFQGAPMLKEYKQILRDILVPDQMEDYIENLSLDAAYRSGYRTLFLDVDNTLMTYEQRTVSLQRAHWIETAKGLGFQIYLLSNNSSKNRIRKVCHQLKVEGVYFACKPFTFSLLDLANRYDIDLKRSIIIGDQLFKDVALGNWLEMRTILVNPLDIRQSFLKTMQRDIELWILDKLGL
jgi:HAD superfamily phosphatase (TIGR01668 family)